MNLDFDLDYELYNMKESGSSSPVYKSQKSDYMGFNIIDFIDRLEYDGIDHNKIKTEYMSYEYYKQIFHFSMTVAFKNRSIFKNELIYDNYPQYNTIHLTPETKIDDFYNNIYKIITLTESNVYFFMDVRHPKESNKWHTTLLIYDFSSKELEHYDPNTVFRYGYVSLFLKCIDMLTENILGFSYISSSELHSRKHKSFEDLKKISEEENNDIRSNSLNWICGIKNNESYGWCQIWSLFMYEMKLRYNTSTSVIIDIIYSKIRNLDVSISHSKAYNIIRGYYNLLLNRTNFIIDSRSLSVSPSSLKEFYPKYVTSDKKLVDLIVKKMDPRIYLKIND